MIRSTPPPAALTLLAGLLAPLVAVGPAHAQPGPPPQEDIVLVGLGAGISASYDGADEYRVIPGGTLQGTISGHDFRLTGPQLFVDAIPNVPGKRLHFELGPVIGLGLNRTGTVRDARVAALGQLDTAVELGLRAGVSFGRVLENTDRIEFTVTSVWDVAGAHGSHVISPGLDYSTLLGRNTYVRAGIAADFVGGGYAAYNYGVTPEGSAASGLRQWEPDGGLESLGSSLLATHSLTGTRTGWALFGIASYRRLQGDMAASPLVRDVGSPDQFFASAGIGYTF